MGSVDSMCNKEKKVKGKDKGRSGGKRTMKMIKIQYLYETLKKNEKCTLNRILHMEISASVSRC